MQPWMIIALLMAAGFATLLIAPRVHRRSTQRAIAAADAHRAKRAAEFRDDPSSVEHPMASLEEALAVRDALLLRGVRSAVVGEPESAVVITRLSDSDAVSLARSEIANGADPAPS